MPPLPSDLQHDSAAVSARWQAPGFTAPLHLRALTPAELRHRGSPRVQIYEVTQPLSYRRAAGDELCIPAGTLTDFASVPSWALWAIDDDAPDILRPAVLHDWLYSRGGAIRSTATGALLHIFSRVEADALLREAMLAEGGTALRAALVYRAVRLGGGSAWKGGRP